VGDPPKATTSASGASRQPSESLFRTLANSSIVPETRLISCCGSTKAMNSEPNTENSTVTATARKIARGTVRPGFSVSRAWKPAISMPVNSRMIPPRNARLFNSMSGTSAPGVNAICDGLPWSRNAAPSTTTRIAGTIEPVTVPIAPSFAEARTPRRLAAVVAQKNTSMTTTRKTLFVASPPSPVGCAR
jgi:hypothetical protein